MDQEKALNERQTNNTQLLCIQDCRVFYHVNTLKLVNSSNLAHRQQDNVVVNVSDKIPSICFKAGCSKSPAEYANTYRHLTREQAKLLHVWVFVLSGKQAASSYRFSRWRQPVIPVSGLPFLLTLSPFNCKTPKTWKITNVPLRR